MLEALRLKNFKSARALDLPLRRLTVLAGLNGSGKSTVLQAVALVKQTLDELGEHAVLPLNGPLVRLGRTEDVLFSNAEDSVLGITVKHDGSQVDFLISAEPEADVLELAVTGDQHDLRSKLGFGFQFIQADRLTPATQYQQASTAHKARAWLGCHGEFTVDFLRRNEDMRIAPARLCRLQEDGVDVSLLRRVAPTPTLRDQTAAWLQQLSPGVTVRAIAFDLAEITSLRFQYTSNRIDAEDQAHRPSNVGFGLTYCLPIVVACLAAEPGSTLLLENPEAHLHPRGQAALGQLIARCCADGVQVLVETHSDHLLNGIRVAVKRRDIDAEGVALHYFTRDVESGATSFDSPRVLPDGQLDRWPSGFFDQWDRSLDALLE